VYEINITREKEGNFMSDFKSYLSNKRKAKEEPHKSRTLEQSFNASQLKNASSLSHSKSQAKDKDRPKYEEELVKKIVKDIAGKCDSSTKIEKMQLIEYLNVNQKIIKVLNVSLDQLSRNIINFPTKDANLMSFN
jgi:predicted lipase